MNRRRFLVLTGGGVVLAATAGAGAFVATRDPAIARQPWQQAGSLYSEPRMRALSYAVLAPSPHNRQSWTVRLQGEDEVIVGYDVERGLPQTDPFDRQLTIGMGCFLELLEMAANADGWRLETSLFPDGSSPQKLDNRPVARIRFLRDANIAADPLFDHVLDRRTNRLAYDVERPVPQAALERVIAAARSVEISGGTADMNDVERLRAITHDAMAVETDTPAPHMESVALFRIGKREINANPDGISLGGPMMEILSLLGLMSREASIDPTSQTFKQARDMILAPLHTSMGFVWLVTGENSRESQIAAGRDWLRMQLACTAEGLAFQPNSQPLQEYPEMASLYEAAHDALAPDGGTVQMLSRIGYAGDVPPSPRWPLESRILAT
ncbi:Acg family FMN-binding oxidoreductase [Oricola sp.]|uniref:Acg family FMN-binding oxidoreductase n=1 Tax=Oricola sp. TaxID=1979950 RepID=UPI003BA85280